MNEDTTQDAPKSAPKLSKGKAAIALGIVTLLIGFTTVQNIRQQGQRQSAIEAEVAARADAILQYVAQQAPAPNGNQSATPGTAALPEYSVSAVEQRAAARDANLDRTIDLYISLIQETNCTRVQFYADTARAKSLDEGISQEDWLLGQLTRTTQEMEQYAINVGYSADAASIASTRSTFQEPLAVAVALRHLYRGSRPECRPDAFPAVTHTRTTVQDAMAVLLMRRDQIANDPTTVIPTLDESVAVPADPAQGVDIVDGGAQ